MKVKLLLNDGEPKADPAVLTTAVKKAGMTVGGRRADVGLVLGGDGLFGACGRSEDMPLLFVGVRSKGATGSKALMAAAYLDDLSAALQAVAEGRYSVEEHGRLEVRRNGKRLGEVFTDVYLQRGSDSNCIRYRVKVSSDGGEFEDAAIGDGVVVTTSAGSTGYYSYPDREDGEKMRFDSYSAVPKDGVGICHITPTYTERLGTGEHPFRYVIPWRSRVELRITRDADARLYGVTGRRKGIGVKMRDVVTILPSSGTTKVVVLKA